MQALREGRLVVMSLCAACSFDTSTAGVPRDSGGEVVDAKSSDAEQAFDALPASQHHLLLSEVKLNDTGTEFIEIYNPTDAEIALSDYYVSDTEKYAWLPGDFENDYLQLDSTDFIARFPDGARIGSKVAQVIAINPNSSEYQSTYGGMPTYRVGGDAIGTPMRQGLNDGGGISIGSSVGLTDNGEGIALFYWDHQSDLVTDVDLVRAGPNPDANDNDLPNKSTFSVDGPDQDNSESDYKGDVFTMPKTCDPSNDTSCTRILPEGGHEAQLGEGNGMLGHDETSEDISRTWEVAPPTPGSVVPAL